MQLIQAKVLADSDPDRERKIEEHVAAYPNESEPLIDTATSLGGKPRVPSTPAKTFIPVGHISLDTEYETPGFADSRDGLYFITTFYISTALQGSGLGRAAMDVIENTAISEPLSAKTLALSTVAKDYDQKAGKWVALGRDPPKVRCS